MSKLMVLS